MTKERSALSKQMEEGAYSLNPKILWMCMWGSNSADGAAPLESD